MKYIALTIGPIYKTLSSAKKTRDLWGGSYLFSYIMKEIISKFKDREFVVPYVGEDIFTQSDVGLFHDRFIFIAHNGDKEKLETTVEEVIAELEKNMKINEDFLKNYLQVSIVEKELEDEANPILKLTPYLDTKELFFKVSQYDKNLLQAKLQGDNSFLKKEAFGNNRSFPSLPEIALADNETMQKKLNKDDELSVYEDETFKKEIKPYHKYIAIVHADGDNMGEVVKSLSSFEDFTKFSKKLFEYCASSHDLIKKYGGETIFAGGDDLLFFAPVVNDKETIFDLIAKISKEFDDLFEDSNQKILSTGKQATLSFGLSITYYKYPLYEALEDSRDLLFGKAKQTGKKNNIAFTITKHSGQRFGGVLSKTNSDNFEKFLNLTSNISDEKESSNFLHSLHHKIYTFKTIFNKVADDEVKLKNFFDNYFSKSEHKQYQKFFDALSEFILEVYQDTSVTEKLELINATLRFVKFIKGDKS